MAELKISIQKDIRPNRKKPYLVRWTGDANRDKARQVLDDLMI